MPVSRRSGTLPGRRERRMSQPVIQALERTATLSAPNLKGRMSEAVLKKEWSIAALLGESVAEPVAQALLIPLGDAPTVEEQIKFMCVLADDKKAVRDLLASKDAALIDALANIVVAAAKNVAAHRSTVEESRRSREEDDQKLEGSHSFRRGPGAPPNRRVSAKFTDKAEFTLSFGKLDAFSRGLEGRIGPPNPNLRDAMAHEHCYALDSHLPFLSGNYGINTTSEIEWW